MELLNFFNFSPAQFILVIIAAFLIGFSKTGLSGMLMVVIPLLADAFGGMKSTGIILPILIVGDLFAVGNYRRHIHWANIKKLMLWTLIGLGLGLIIGKYINDSQFKITIAIMVLLCLAILVYSERKGDQLKVPNKVWFYALTGILAGFATMIGNAAGPIFTIYLLSMGFKKNEYMGTNSIFFFLVNITKVPLQVFVWQNITWKTVLLTGCVVPFVALGAWLGVTVIKKINEKIFRHLIIALTAISAIRLFF
ncbi:MAG: sulfite exporter TauE/SafE family protein [Peptococcaceae bacterium]|nr:sulfite exporter TauE/SafE family protein [Peptococcaceae bacterium]